MEIARERTTLTVSHADLQVVIRQAIAAVRSRPEFHSRIVELVSEAPMTGEFDAPKLERVFFNLLLNGCQVTMGRIGVTVSNTEDTFECRVWDTGTGIPESIRETLFEPFVSAEKNNGTGLGLAIAAKIVHDHGGSIHVAETSGNLILAFMRPVPRGPCTSIGPVFRLSSATFILK